MATRSLPWYLYEAMNREKAATKERLQNRISLYDPIIRLIYARRGRKLHRSHYVAGCFLNPQIYFQATFSNQKEVVQGFLVTITALVR